MKKVNLFFIAAISSALVLSSCTRQPEASFTTDKDEYRAGETVKATNTSLDAHHYEWSWSSSEKTSAEDLNLELSINENPGTFTLKMTAYSDNEKKKDEATKTIKVKDWSERFVGSWSSSGCGASVASASGAKSVKFGELTINLTDALTGNIVPLSVYDEDAEEDLEYSGTAKITKDGKTVTLNLTIKDSDGNPYGTAQCVYTK
jgi:PKD repeat protein